MKPFHLALPCYDLEKTREFYRNVLQLSEKRSAFNWVDFDFYGHQVTFHLVKENQKGIESTMIDGDQVPARHFGAILSEAEWNALRDRLIEFQQRFVPLAWLNLSQCGGLFGHPLSGSGTHRLSPSEGREFSGVPMSAR